MFDDTTKEEVVAEEVTEEAEDTAEAMDEEVAKEAEESAE